MRIAVERSLLALGVGLALLGTSCSKSIKQTSEAKMSRMDSVAYTFGLLNGESFRRVVSSVPGDSLSRKFILAGLRDKLEDKPASLSLEEARAYFQDYVKEVQERENKVLMERNDSVLKANAQKPDVKTTESGLQYRVLKNGSGAKVGSERDTVQVHYEGRLIDGKVFDSSYKRNQPATFPLNQVIQGWTEGVALMNVGSKYEFYLPAHLAYGERGAGADIPPHSTLIFEIELLDVKRHIAVEGTVEGAIDVPLSPDEAKTAVKKARKGKKK